MAHNTAAAESGLLSESVQMYLATIARLQEGEHPVPLSALAGALSISPVSVNEMCRRLHDQGFITYQPYKGASLTDTGQQRARRILRRHRLWEVLLVSRLGFQFDQAHAIACQLEHATPDALADRLDQFLDYPPVSPVGDRIPRPDGRAPVRPTVALSALIAGQRGRVVGCRLDGAPRTFLEEHGIRPGAWLEVAAAAAEGTLVKVGPAHVSLALSLAQAIEVETETPSPATNDDQDTHEQASGAPGPVRDIREQSQMQTTDRTPLQKVPLSTLRVGQRATIVHVGGKGPVKQRMMDMGLVPGSEVSVRRVAPLGDPIEFTVKGYSLSLRKSEAESIQVELAR